MISFLYGEKKKFNCAYILGFILSSSFCHCHTFCTEFKYSIMEELKNARSRGRILDTVLFKIYSNFSFFFVRGEKKERKEGKKCHSVLFNPILIQEKHKI